jgi:hypothetical protein
VGIKHLPNGLSRFVLGAGLECCLLLAFAVRAPADDVLKYHQTLTSGEAVSLSATGDVGADIRVTGGDGSVADAEVRSTGALADRVQITGKREGNVLVLEVGLKPGSSSWRTWLHLHDTNATVILHVPRSVKLALSDVNGPISVDGVTGPLTVKVVNGPIEATNVGAILSLNSTNGPIDVRLTDLSAVPAIELHTVNGAIDVSVPKSFKAKISARVLVGSVDVIESNATGPGHMELSLVAGAISVKSALKRAHASPLTSSATTRA